MATITARYFEVVPGPEYKHKFSDAIRKISKLPTADRRKSLINSGDIRLEKLESSGGIIYGDTVSYTHLTLPTKA